MKKILVFCIISLLTGSLAISNAYSQKANPNPMVENDSSDENSSMTITTILTGVGDEKITIVAFRYVTSLFKPWIRLSSRTTLTTGNSKYNIIDWGLINENEDINDMFSSLQFNHEYNIKRRVSYYLYMVFPKIPTNATRLNIIEPGEGGFYWTGIHINNSSTEDFSKGSSKSPPNNISKGAPSRYNEFRPSSSGSGFAISRDGYIATCNHVVANASAIRIKGVNGDFDRSLMARVVATDAQNDLAILKITDERFMQIPYSLASGLSDVGEDIFVLGYPQTQNLGEELKLTTGVISSRSGYRGDRTTYQISAQVLAGNSGCPLFDNNGNVIGIVNAKYIEPNVSYAVKATYLKQLIERENINLTLTVSNSIAGKSLSEKVKSVRNFVYIIEVQQ